MGNVFISFEKLRSSADAVSVHYRAVDRLDSEFVYSDIKNYYWVIYSDIYVLIVNIVQ